MGIMFSSNTVRLNHKASGITDWRWVLSAVQSRASARFARLPSLSKLKRAFSAIEESVLVDELFSFCAVGISAKEERSRTDAKNASMMRICPLLFLTKRFV